MTLKLHKIIFIVMFFALLQVNNLFAQENFSDKLIKFSEDSEISSSLVSFYAIDLNSNEVVGELNPNMLLSPASTMKIVTTSAALEILGADYTFKTKVNYSGNINNGVLNGNLIVKGEGDPCFLSSNFSKHYSSYFTELIDTIKKLGITKIHGKIIGNSCFYTDNLYPSTWILADVANYYGAAPWALSIFDNEYKVFFKTGENKGDSTKITKIEPYLNFLNIKNFVTTDNVNSDQSIIYGGQFDNYRIVSGNLPLKRENFEVKGSIPSPPYFAALYFKNIFKNNSIIIDDTADYYYEFSELFDTINNQNLIFKFNSPPLKDIIYYTNIKSINLYAEHLLRQISLKLIGEASNKNGIIAITNFWKEKTGKFIMYDGSGLSRFNAISAKQIVSIIKYMKNESKNYTYFYNSLPVAGKSGSISGMFKGTYAENNLHAKSGYMSGVRSYAGVVKSKSGKNIAFAIIINNYTSNLSEIKSKIEHLLINLSEI